MWAADHLRDSGRRSHSAAPLQSEFWTVHRDLDSALLQLAARQHGIVARWQLTGAGISARSVDNRIRRGTLERMYRSVYRVGALVGPRAPEMARVFSCGPYAVASHQTAADIHAMLDNVPAPAVVTMTRGHPDPRPEVRICRFMIASNEVTICDGVPATTPSRTVLDLAGVLPPRQFEQMLASALRRSLASESEILALVAKYPHREGVARLVHLLAPSSRPAFTRSAAEEQFLDLLRRTGLPAPVANSRLLGWEVDFYWRAERLVVEVDGLAFHSSRSAQQSDRRRDATLAAAGLRVIRFTWSDLTHRVEATIATLALALGRSA